MTTLTNRSVDAPATAGTPLGRFFADSHGSEWDVGRITTFWRLLARDRMREALDIPAGPTAETTSWLGRDRAVYDAAWVRLQDLVHRASNGAFVQHAHDGAQLGFLDAACDFWRAVARIEMAAVGPDGDGDPVCLRLELEVRRWSRAERPLGRLLAEAVNDGFTEAYCVPPEPHLALVPAMRIDLPAPPRHRRVRR